MDDATDNELSDQLVDLAIRRRLAALRSTPIDVSRLRQAVDAVTARPPRRALFGWRAWPGSIRAVAASLLVMGLIAGLIVALSSGPVMASPERMLQVHEAVIAGDDHSIPVQSIESANDALNRQWPHSPGLPSVKHDQVMSCCVHRVGSQNVSCAAMKIDGVAVSMAIADAADIRMPSGPTVERNGVTYHVQSAKSVNMAMTVRNNRWACLMGPLPVEKLIEALGTLKW